MLKYIPYRISLNKVIIILNQATNKYNELQTAWKLTGPTLWTQDKPLFSYLLVGF